MSYSRLRIVIVCSKIVNERQLDGSHRYRLNLTNGMRVTALTTVNDDSRTMLPGGIAPQRLSPLQARSDVYSVISALPFT